MNQASANVNKLNALQKYTSHNASVIIHPGTGEVFQANPNGGDITYSAENRLGQLTVGGKEFSHHDRNQNPQIFAAENAYIKFQADGKLVPGAAYLKQQEDMAQSGISTPYSAAATPDLEEVVEHIRVVKLHPELGGTPAREFHAHKRFRSAQAPFLDFRIALRDPNIGGIFRAGPDVDPEHTRSTYYEARLTCRKDMETIGYPIETRMRATQWDPQTVDAENAGFALEFKRNAACIQELHQLGNRVGTDGLATTNGTLPEISARNSNGSSENNILSNLMNIMTKQFNYHHTKFGDWWMNPLILLHITQNDLLRAGGEFGRTPIAMPFGGTVQLPTLPGINIVTDIRLPADRIFMADANQALWIGEGPKRMDTIDIKTRQATYVNYTDWYEPYCIHRDITRSTGRRYGCTVFTHANDRTP